MTAEDLRKAILQQAIQGKLVPQDPNDEPASVLLERIREEKDRLVKEKKIKKDKNESIIYRGEDNSHYEKFADGTVKCIDDEIPFDIPQNWSWCRLFAICTFLSRGKSPKYSNEKKYPVFAQKCNLKSGGISLDQARFLDPTTLSKWSEEYKLRTGDILVNSTGTGTVCRTRLFDNKYLGNYPFVVPDSHVSVVRTHHEIISDFICHYITSPTTQKFLENNLAGSTNQKELYIGILTNLLIPIPPKAEQERISKKISELLLKSASYDVLYNQLLSVESELQPQLKKSILQYAIQGKLVAQNPSDEPASELLKRINEEKEQLIKDGKIKRDKNTSIIFKGDDNKYYEKLGKSINDITDDLPFEIPHNWEWTTLNMVTYSVGNKINQIQTKDILKTGNIPVVSQGQSLIDGYCEAKNKVVTDLPLIMFGDHTRNVKFIDFPFVIGADGTKFHKCICISADFLYFWMVVIAEQLRDRGYARHYSLLKKTYFPLPPLNEQYRIVKKIKQILKGIEG